jgi:hypothetical protein
MKINQLLLLILGSLLACEAKVSLRPRGRNLVENTTSSAGTSTSNGKSNVTYASRTDDTNDDDGASLKDDSKTKDDADTGNNGSKPFVFVHKKESSILDGTDDNIAFTPPKEIEPPFWKPFVAAFFLFLALLLCVITAGKRFCRVNGYREIPSTTLVV